MELLLAKGPHFPLQHPTNWHTSDIVGSNQLFTQLQFVSHNYVLNSGILWNYHFLHLGHVHQ